MSQTLDRVLAAWRLSPASHQLNEPADDRTIAEAERALGRPLPDALGALYRFSDGMSALGGNLSVVPLLGSDAGGLVDMSDLLRGWGWPIPAEVLVFGGNGTEDQFGVWYPPGAQANGATPVVIIGSIFEPACLALAGTDLGRFLLAWSSYYLVLIDAPNEALDALGLPDALRRIDADAGLAPYFRWADPTLPDPAPDPYVRGLDAAGIGSVIERLQATTG